MPTDDPFAVRMDSKRRDHASLIPAREVGDELQAVPSGNEQWRVAHLRTQRYPAHLHQSVQAWLEFRNETVTQTIQGT